MDIGKKYYIYNYSDDEYYQSIDRDGEVYWVKDIMNAESISNLNEAKKIFDKLKEDWCVNLLEVDTKVIE